jgi:hypothetical protein
MPPLPWLPRAKPAEDYLLPFTIVMTLGFVLSGLDLVNDDHIRWWDWLKAPVGLLGLWSMLGLVVSRLTVRADGIVITRRLVRREASWDLVERVEVDGQAMTIDLGRRGRHSFEYDAKNARPSALDVAGVLERGRLLSTSGLTRYKVSLSWGAAVFLPAVAVVVFSTALALFKG